MARYRFRCSETGLQQHCDVELEDENEENLRATAEEHLHTDHPDEALEQEKARSYLIAGMKPA